MAGEVANTATDAAVLQDDYSRKEPGQRRPGAKKKKKKGKKKRTAKRSGPSPIAQAMAPSSTQPLPAPGPM